MDYRVRANGSYLTVGFTRSRILPWGLDGGSEGSPNYATVIRTDGTKERYAYVSGVIVNKDDIIRIVTGAGGGFGDPKQESRGDTRGYPQWLSYGGTGHDGVRHGVGDLKNRIMQ